MGGVKQAATLSPTSSIVSTATKVVKGIVLVRFSLNSKIYRSLLPRSPWSVDEQTTLARRVMEPDVVST